MNPWIDITVTIRNGMLGWPGDSPVDIKLQQALARGDEANVSHLKLSAHTGTHIDAPLHYLREGASLDDLPPDATLGLVRILKIQDACCVTVHELEPYELERGERVIFKTRNSKSRWESKPFRDDYVYVSPGAARYLVGRGIRTVGVDYLSVGAPGKQGAETHRILLSAGVWVIEGLALHDVEPGEYELLCLPLKIAGAEGSPVRALIRRAG